MASALSADKGGIVLPGRGLVKVCNELIKSLPTGLELGHIKAFHPEGMWKSCWEAGFSLGLSQG